MKTYKKIDLYFMGDYWCSTNQSKTCKEAVKKCLESITRSGLQNGTTLQAMVYRMMLKTPKDLKARFSK